MKTEDWPSGGKIIKNGISDFGLLRNESPKPEYDGRSKFRTIYISRLVILIAILAGLILIVCLVLTNKFQKNTYYYAKYTNDLFDGYEQLPEHLPSPLDGNQIHALANPKLQNVTDDLPIRDINDLLPITTILHSVNQTNQLRAIVDQKLTSKFRDYVTNHTKPGTRRPKNLAELLKRTELKPVNVVNVTSRPTDVSFAQLETYKHARNPKSFSDLMKYMSCPECHNPSPIRNNMYDRETFQTDESDMDYSADSLSADDDLSFADSNAYYSYSPRFRKPDPFVHYRPTHLAEINDMEDDTTERHRFSNRIYTQQESPRNFETGELDPFLTPPTPPPISMSLTPSYTSAIFHHNDVNKDTELAVNSQTNQFDSRLTSSSDMVSSLNNGITNLNIPPNHGIVMPNFGVNFQQTIPPVLEQVKNQPISLMVEIFPANDYELPGSLFGDNQMKKPSQFNTNPLPWKIQSHVQNRMRLYVNLFPQQLHEIGKRFRA